MTKFAWRVTFTVCLRRSDTLGEIQVAGRDFGVAIEFAPATQWRHQYSRLFLMDCPITGGTPTACSNTSIDIFPPVRSIQYHPTLWTNSSAHTAAPVRYPMARATTRRGRKTNSTTSARRGRPSACRSMSSPKHPCSAVSSHRSGSFAPNATGVAFQAGHWMVHEAPELVLAEMKSVFQRVGD
jgi:pimeloyl-ACP methyl ester carboxylesterase